MKNFTFELALLTAAFLIAAVIGALAGAGLMLFILLLFCSVVSGSISMTKSN
jgi:hypothetical protein